MTSDRGASIDPDERGDPVADEVLVDVDDAIMIIMTNRPEARNAVKAAAGGLLRLPDRLPRGALAENRTPVWQGR